MADPSAQGGVMKYNTILQRAECLIDYWPHGEDRDVWVAKCYKLNYGKRITVATVRRARHRLFDNSQPMSGPTIPASAFRD